MKSEAAVGTGETWQEALSIVKAAMPGLGVGPVDLALLFACDAWSTEYGDLLAAVRELVGPDAIVIGCSSWGIIGGPREVEDEPALALQTFSLPGADVQVLQITQSDLNDDSLKQMMEGPGRPQDVAAFMLFADPYTINGEQLLNAISDAFPGVPVVGGLASGDQRRQQTAVFLNDEAMEYGAVGVTIGGDYAVHTVVAQGCMPIGEPWTITGVSNNLIETIGMRPAMDVLIETYNGLSPEVQARAQSNIFVGLAMDEYVDDFRRGDFLVRNLIGLDQQTGAIAVGAMPREGQTLQFHLRDPEAADADLEELLGRAKDELGGAQPVGALLCSCNGRGIGLFGTPDHDAAAVQRILGPMAVSGFFCNGEIGPIRERNFLHGYTASIIMILKK